MALEGLPPVRHIYAPKSEVIGVDSGPSKVAYYCEREVGLVELAWGIQDYRYHSN